jgi:hypothetical protein
MNRAFLAALLLPILAACTASTSTAGSDTAEARAKEPAQRGEACGSDVAIRRECDKGLTCVFPEDGPISEHTPGVCLPAAGEGEACGSDVAIQKWCTDGLECVFPDGPPVSEHTPGVCTRKDPCDGIDLPACPEPCTGPLECGQACDDEGATCGNSIGDGRVCQNGRWGCSVHAPLGLGCNLVCRPQPKTPKCEDLDLAACGENPACHVVPGFPCDPIPGGPACPPNLGPHCASNGLN